MSLITSAPTGLFEFSDTSLIAKVLETDCDRKFLALDRGDGGLQIVTAFSSDADLLVLDLRGDLEFGLANEGGDLLGHGCFDALLDFDGVARMAEGRNFRLALVDVLHADLPLGQFVDDDFMQGAHLEFIVRRQLDFVLIENDLRFASFEIKSRCQFLFGLVDRVLDFHRAHFRNNVK